MAANCGEERYYGLQIDPLVEAFAAFAAPVLDSPRWLADCLAKFTFVRR